MIRYTGMKVALEPNVPIQANQWRNDFAIWRWCRQNTLISHRDQQKWEIRAEHDPKIKMFGISGVKNQLYVGVCGLTGIDNLNQKAEFSLYIAPEYRRHGFARDALLTLLKHGFDDFNLNRIWGETFDGNPAADLFWTLGMKNEGRHAQTYFRSGRFVDSLTFSFLRESFYARYRDRLGDCLERSSDGREHRPIAGKFVGAVGAEPAGHCSHRPPVYGPTSWSGPQKEPNQDRFEKLACELGELIGRPETKGNPERRTSDCREGTSPVCEDETRKR